MVIQAGDGLFWTFRFISGSIVKSTDSGGTWDNATSPTANYLRGIVFGNNTFVAVGDSGNIVRSDNGSSFDNVTSPVTTDLYGVGFGNSTFVAVGDNGTILRSTMDNGSSWDNATSPTPNQLRGVGF